MAKEKTDNKIQIWVAIITVIGVIGAAVISNWDKIIPTKDISPVVTNESNESKIENGNDVSIDEDNEITAIEFMREYYSDIKKIPYSESWTKLSKPFRDSIGYPNYLKWWDRDVLNVFVSNIKSISNNRVQVELLYQLKNKKPKCSIDTFSLIKNNDSWLINNQKYQKCTSK